MVYLFIDYDDSAKFVALHISNINMKKKCCFRVFFWVFGWLVDSLMENFTLLHGKVCCLIFCRFPIIEMGFSDWVCVITVILQRYFSSPCKDICPQWRPSSSCKWDHGKASWLCSNSRNWKHFLWNYRRWKRSSGSWCWSCIGWLGQVIFGLGLY